MTATYRPDLQNIEDLHDGPEPDSLAVSVDLVRGELDDLLEVDHGLTPWEIQFIEDLVQRLENGPLPLTDRQLAKLHQIWDRRCA